MSLFGKILTVLNLLGAAALIYLASVDYSVRQQWAYVAFRYDLMLQGIPLDANQTDKRGLPIVEQITDDALRELFSTVGGNPSRTQLDEVAAVRSRIDSTVAAHQADPRAQSFVLANILMPFADTLLERDEYLAIQTHFQDDKTLAALKNRYQTAIAQAKRPGISGADRTFEMAFRLAVRAQGGVPSEAYTNWIAAKLPNDASAAVDVDALFKEAVELQRQVMLKRLDTLFAAALTTAEQSTGAAADRPKNSPTSQRAAIARLLFGLSNSLAATPEELPRLLTRVYVVCGIKTGLNAITARTTALREIEAQINSAIDDERTQFLSDEFLLLEQARMIAARWRDELASIAENTANVNKQALTVKSRQADVEQAEAELKASLQVTEATLKELQQITERVRVARIQARDLLDQLSQREQTIRQLEQKVQIAETKAAKR
ncbi:MAG: hypothetical protein SNJ82_07715 [Gemmataceae bacterium]